MYFLVVKYMAWAYVKRCQKDFYLSCWWSMTEVKIHVPSCAGIQQVYRRGLVRMETMEGFSFLELVGDQHHHITMSLSEMKSPRHHPRATESEPAEKFYFLQCLINNKYVNKISRICLHIQVWEVPHLSTIRRLHLSTIFGSVPVIIYQIFLIN